MPHPWLRGLTRVAEVGSTSDLARELVRAPGLICPHLVRADRQTNGRGRGSNAWWSDAGSLTFTLVIDPAAHALSAAHEPRLALTAAVAAVAAVAELVDLPPSFRLGVRWPNDVEADGRKLGGVLPERVETTDGPRILIGVGLNVRTRLADAPAAVRAMATSLSDFPDAPDLDPDALLAHWLDYFAALLPDLAADAPALADRWSALDLLRDAPVRIDLGPRVLQGVARGITPAGALLVETPESGVIPRFGGRVLRD